VKSDLLSIEKKGADFMSGKKPGASFPSLREVMGGIDLDDAFTKSLRKIAREQANDFVAKAIGNLYAPGFLEAGGLSTEAGRSLAKVKLTKKEKELDMLGDPYSPELKLVRDALRELESAS